MLYYNEPNFFGDRSHATKDPSGSSRNDIRILFRTSKRLHYKDDGVSSSINSTLVELQELFIAHYLRQC